MRGVSTNLTLVLKGGILTLAVSYLVGVNAHIYSHSLRISDTLPAIGLMVIALYLSARVMGFAPRSALITTVCLSLWHTIDTISYRYPDMVAASDHLALSEATMNFVGSIVTSSWFRVVPWASVLLIGILAVAYGARAMFIVWLWFHGVLLPLDIVIETASSVAMRGWDPHQHMQEIAEWNVPLRGEALLALPVFLLVGCVLSAAGNYAREFVRQSKGQLPRSRLRTYAQETADHLEEKPYDYWLEQELPVTYEDVVDGRTLQVEVDVLENRPEYFHFSLSVSDGPLSQYFPVSTSRIVPSEES